MAYSRSPKTVRNFKEQYPGTLDEIEAGRPCSWKVDQGKAWKWAYKIREVLEAGAANESEFPQLASANKRFVVEVVDPATVQARVSENSTVGEIQAGGTPVHGLEPAGRSHTVVGVNSVFAVIEAWQKAQPTNTPLHFPQADLSDAELRQLHSWASALAVPWMLLIPKGTRALTLAPHDPAAVAAGAVWSPTADVLDLNSLLGGDDEPRAQ